MLRKVTDEEPENVVFFVTQHLIPWLLSPNLPESSSSAQRDCRVLLCEWINQYPDPMRTNLLQRCIDNMMIVLREQPTRPTCWIISTLGYRRSDIVAELLRIAKQYDDELGDTALGTLVSLGVHGSERQEVLNELHRRITVRLTWPLLGGLSDLADVTTIPIVAHGLQHSFSAMEQYSITRTLVLKVLVDIADAHIDDEKLQHAIWNTLVTLYFLDQAHDRADLSMSSQMAPRCNDPRVPQQLLEWLEPYTEDTDCAKHTRYLLYLRFLESIRPQQIQALPTYSVVFPPHVLYQDAQQDTKNTSLWATSAMYAKERAWDVLLNLGDTKLLQEEMFQEAIVRETSGFARKEIMELLACFHWERLPEQVLTWITDRIDLSQETAAQELAFRRGAEQLAQSSGTRKGFEALLAFGMTFQGETLRETANALANIALDLVKRGEAGIIEKLIASLDKTNEERHRLVALQALLWIADDSLLPSEYLTPLLAALHEPERTDLERSYFIHILGELSSKVSIPNFPTLLEDFANTRQLHTGVSAVEELVHTGILRTTPGLLEKYLPLYHVGTQWDFNVDTKISYEMVGLICSLYRQAPQDFLPAIATLLERSEGVALSHLLAMLKEMSVSSSDVPNEIGFALSNRLKSIGQQTWFDHSNEVLKTSASLIPGVVVTWPWDEYEDYFAPETRAALVEALEQATQKLQRRSGGLLETTSSIQHLLHLAGDTHYQVRRAAYCGLAHLAPHALLQFGIACAYSPFLEGRRRSVEALNWLHFTTVYQQITRPLLAELRYDPESLVREVIAFEQNERRRQIWANDYLRQVQKTYGENNQQRLLAWRYACALTQVGDDSTIVALQSDLSHQTLASYERRWLIWILKNLQEQWKKTVEKWPKPWFAWGKKGIYEHGQIVFEDQKGVSGIFYLYPDEVKDPSGPRCWFGTFFSEESLLTQEKRGKIELFHARRGEVELIRQIAGRYWYLRAVFEPNQ